MADSNKTVRQLDEEAKLKLLEVKSIYDKGDDATPEDLERAETLADEAAAIEERLVKVRSLDGAKTANRVANTLATLNRPAERPSFAVKSADGGRDGFYIPNGAGFDGGSAFKSAGEQFVDSDDWRTWVKTMLPAGDGGSFPRIRFQSNPFLISSGLKTLVRSGSSAAGGAMVFSDQRRDILGNAPFRPFVVRDLITVLTTASDTVEFVRITGYTNNAAPVAEATSTSTGTKPESALAMERVSIAVKNIAHWIPATTRVLSDAGQLRGIIDSFLRDGLNEELEDQIVQGDGTGENFTGLLYDAGVLNLSFTTDILTTARKARTNVQTGAARVIPNGYIMNPADWETIDLLQDAEQRYYFGGPMQMGTPRLWGLPVAETQAMPSGTATCGDHKEAILWDREQMMVTVGNQHSDYFVKNIVVLLAELRAAFGIRRPAAICKFAFSA